MDLHSKVAYGHEALKRSSGRLVMKIYQESISANYGKTKETSKPTAKELAEAAFRKPAVVSPFEPSVPNYSHAIIHPPKDKAA